MKRALYAVLLVVVAIPAHLHVQGQSVYIKHYTTNDGLAGNHAYMCHQDNNGYLWIATTSGLSRFDGKKFKNYGHEDGLSDNEVLFVTNDADNNIWVKTFSASPAISVVQNTTRYNDHNAIPRPIDAYTVSDELYSDRGKVTYLNGTRAIICISHGKARRVLAPVISGSPLFETGDGKFFSGDGKNLYTVHDTIVRFFQSLDIPQLYTRLCYYGGILYAVVENTLRLYKYSSNKFNYLTTAQFKENINLVHVNRYGVWLTFIDKKGLHLYRDYQMLSKHAEIPVTGIVNYMMTDKEGGVWICTSDNGIFYIPYADMVNYTVNDGLASSVVYTLDPLSPHTFWAGYNTGNAELIDIHDGRANIKRKVAQGAHQRSNDFVVGIAHDSKGKIYVLSRSRLLAVEDGKVLTSKNAHKSMLMVNDSIIGIGAWNYTLLNLKTLKQDDYQTGRVYAQAKDSAGNLWLGGMNGLYYMHFNPGAQLIGIKGLAGIKINTLALSGSYVWVGSQNNGIYLMKGDKVISRFTDKNIPALPSNNIKALAAKGAELWIGTNRGILHTVFDYSKFQFREILLLDHNDGLLSPEVNDIKIFDSSVFIATYAGVTVINNYRRDKLYYRVPDVFVRDGRSYNQVQSDSVTFPYSTKGMEIGIQAAALKYAGDISYRYMLMPFDKDWETTKANLIQYTNIPPGHYTFIATAFDNRGNASIGAAYRQIYIRPLYWQTVWFKCIMVMVTLAIIVLLVYGYFRAAKKRMESRIIQGQIIARARLEVLRSQLKPHFIFNSLNAIKDYIYSNKNEDAANLLQGFAGLVRKGLNLADKDFITIAEEVNFLKQYLELEQFKCDSCFDYIIDVPEKITTIVIPSLITQPFVENAVTHGMRSVKNEKAVLYITYSLNNNDVVCCIADNGIGVKQSMRHKKATASKGTLISKERINYFRAGLGIEIELDIADLSETDEMKHGTIVTIITRNALKLSKNENRDQGINY